jgi:putative transposase
MRKETFVNDNFYHIYNRGVDKRLIFLESRDYERFLMALYLFNDSNQHDYDLAKIKLRGLASCKRGESLVDIIHWCLMPNHFHLVLRQREENGISTLMHKIGTSYTMFFNLKHERSGRLFQGTFKAKKVSEDEYFSHLASYVPLNALDLLFPKWKVNGIDKEEIEKAKNFLLQYKWSSFADYFGKSSVPNLVSKEVFFDTSGCSKGQYMSLIDTFLLQGLTNGTGSAYADELLHYEA